MQYPTIGQPQYGFAPTMPGMASGGLASLPVKRFQRGGLSDTAIGGLFAPTQVGPLSVTPASMIGLVAPPPISAPLAALSAYNAFMAKQDPAPIMEAKTAAEVEAQQAQKDTDIAAVQDAEDQALGQLAAMTQQQQQQEQDPSTPDISDVAATVAATQDAVDAEGGQTVGAPAPASTTAGTGTDTGAGAGTPSIGDQQSVDSNMNVQDAPSDGGGGGSSCFLTTAAVKHMGQKDNGEVLNTLRNFRDTYMQKDREKNKDVQWYYTNAPRIMRALDARKDAGSVYREMYNDYVIPAYRNIKAGKNAEAYADYKRLVNFAKRESGIDNEALTPKPKHYMYGGQVMNYEQGGLAAAQQTQSKGRGQDTMLVHMTPKEVGGLQALAMAHGGSLTINPQTGLPEAGFLSAILPMVAGFALGPAGFGLMSSALGAGAVVGGLTGLATGSLKKGLMAGLGAYGGFGLGEGLVSAATPVEAAATQVTQAPTSAFNLAQSNIDPSILESGLGAGSKESIMQQAMQSPAYQQALTSPQLGSSALDTMSAADVAQAKVLPGQMITTTPAIPAPAGFEAATSGFENVFKPAAEGGAEYRKAFGAALPYGTTVAAGAPLAMAAAEPPKGPEPSKSFIRGYDLDITNPSGTPQYTPQDTREREQVRYAFSPRPIYEAAQGGLTALNGQTYDDEYGRDEYAPGGSVKKRKVTSLRGNPYYKFAQDRKDSSMEAAIDQNFAKGGLGALPPRFLSGGGDGMSDSIKARIGGVQEARLADGEFVVPADVVSHLVAGQSLYLYLQDKH